MEIYKEQFFFVAPNYATEWVEARTLKTNTILVIAKKLYECILTRSGCPLIIITN
jgi:hypothetical protein